MFSIPKTEISTTLSNSIHRIVYRYKFNFNTFVINLLELNSHNIIMAFGWDTKNNFIRYQFDDFEMIQIENISSIIQDYEEMDITSLFCLMEKTHLSGMNTINQIGYSKSYNLIN